MDKIEMFIISSHMMSTLIFFFHIRKKEFTKEYWKNDDLKNTQKVCKWAVIGGWILIIMIIM